MSADGAATSNTSAAGAAASSRRTVTYGELIELARKRRREETQARRLSSGKTVSSDELGDALKGINAAYAGWIAFTGANDTTPVGEELLDAKRRAQYVDSIGYKGAHAQQSSRNRASALKYLADVYKRMHPEPQVHAEPQVHTGTLADEIRAAALRAGVSMHRLCREIRATAEYVYQGVTPRTAAGRRNLEKIEAALRLKAGALAKYVVPFKRKTHATYRMTAWAQKNSLLRGLKYALKFEMSIRFQP
jgi:hypothetical protein